MSTDWTDHGRLAYGALRSAVAALKRDDPMAPVTVLVRTNLTGTHVRRALAHGVGGGPGIAVLDVLTVDRLAERIGAPVMAGSGRRPATRPVLAAAWRRALQIDPGHFGPVAGHPATVRALAAAHTQLREVDEPGLDKIAAAGPISADLVRLHRIVEDTLAADWYDVVDLRAIARDLPPAVVTFLLEDLRPSEQAMLDRVADRIDIGAVEREARPHEVISASDADDEVRAIVRRVMADLRETPAHRVAILHGADRPYARLLADHLRAAGIRWHGRGVTPTAERRLARVLTNLFATARNNWRRADVIGVLADTEARTTARWERISRAAGVIQGDDWDSRLKAYAAARRAAGRHDADSADELRRAVTDLQDRMRDGESLRSWTALAEWGRQTYAALVGEPEERRLPEAEKRAAVAVARTLDAVAGLDTVEPAADLSLLDVTLDLELADDLPSHGRIGDGVLVAPISGATGLDVDKAYVLGLAEDIVPGRIGVDALLPDEIRELVPGQLATTAERVARIRRQVWAAFAVASAVVASYPRGDLRRSAERRPSRWLPATVTEQLPSYAAALTATTELASDQEWRIRQATAGRIDDPIVALAAEMRRARASDLLTRFDGDLSGHDLPDPAGGGLISPTSLEAWIRCPHGYLMEKLLRVRPVEALEEQLTISPIELGNLYHHALDRFFAEQDARGAVPAGAVPWSPGQRADLRRIAIEVAGDLSMRGQTGHRLLWRRELATVLSRLDGFLTADDELRATTGRHQVCSELAFGQGGRPPVPVPLPDGRIVLMKGSADRVDRAGDSIVIVDYKSGRSEPFAGLGPDDPTLGGAKLQLPVYGLAARLALGAPRADVTAEYWFVHRDAGKRVELPLTPDIEVAFTNAVTVIVDRIAGGLFPHRPPDDDGYGDHIPCRYCDPDGLGAGEHRDRWDRKRNDPRLASYLSLIGGGA
ncbi:PD-(D/E)XK nuclease family protein [Actinoplanes sp. NPDC051633]|uniref:PD-(D/E)XK nuclease family protein n=1 Tax=Actinoplanes sp. NPDC051633 TaxID=3155670 RepID=UPI00344552FB